MYYKVNKVWEGGSNVAVGAFDYSDMLNVEKSLSLPDSLTGSQSTDLVFISLEWRMSALHLT